MALTLKDIQDRIGTGKTKIRKLSKKAWDLGWLEHSNKLMGNHVVKEAKKLPAGLLKDRMTEMGKFMVLHDEMCWPDFIDYFNEAVPNPDGTSGWYPYPEGMRWILDTFIPHKFAKKLIGKYLRHLYPDVEETKWS